MRKSISISRKHMLINIKYRVSEKKDTHLQINTTLNLIKMNGFLKYNFVRLSLLHLCGKYTNKTTNIFLFTLTALTKWLYGGINTLEL